MKDQIDSMQLWQSLSRNVQITHPHTRVHAIVSLLRIDVPLSRATSHGIAWMTISSKSARKVDLAACPESASPVIQVVILQRQ